VALRALDPARAQSIHPAHDRSALQALAPEAAVAAKESFGGTGPRSVEAQIAWLHERSSWLAEKAAAQGSIDEIAERVFNEPVKRA
jgi:hypothetical protein